MKTWKKRWKDELSAVTPPLSEEVKNAPILFAGEEKTVETVREYEKSGSFKAWFGLHKKRFAACLAACVAVIVAACALLPALFAPIRAKAETTAFIVEINPKAVFSVGKDGKISAVVASNADADVILSDEDRVSDMIGKTAAEGARTFVDYAAKLGYLTLDDPSAVRVVSYQKEGALKGVKSGLEKYFREKGAYVAVVGEVFAGEEFCALAETAFAETAGHLEETLRGLPTLYSQRVAEGKSEEELKVLYGETVSFKELEDLIALMELLGMDTTALKALLELPQTLAEYTEKMAQYLSRQYDELLKKYEKSYGQVRDEISSVDYQRYIEGLVAEYGSLAEYWENLKN